MKRISVSVNEEMYRRLLAIADKDSRTLSAVVRLLIDDSKHYWREEFDA